MTAQPAQGMQLADFEKGCVPGSWGRTMPDVWAAEPWHAPLLLTTKRVGDKLEC